MQQSKQDQHCLYLQGGGGKACINTLGYSYFLIIYENVKRDVKISFC